MVGQLSRDDIVNRLVFLKVRKNVQLVLQHCCKTS